MVKSKERSDLALLGTFGAADPAAGAKPVFCL